MTEIPEFVEICDFCGATGPVMEFAVDEAAIAVQVTALDGRILRATVPTPPCWRACSGCALLIHAGDRVGLLDRSHHMALGHVRALIALSPARRKQFLREHRRGLVKLHRQFWAGCVEDDEQDDGPAAA